MLQIMNNYFSFSGCRVVLSFLLFLPMMMLSAQPDVVDAVGYKQISQFETNPFITTMKMSADGSTIVYATGGPMVKVFTMGTDGTGLTEIYDFQRTGTGPMLDISASGDKVIWCDGEGEIFIANSDGSAILELATLIPNPDTNFADLEPIIPLPPRITEDGGTVYFINRDRDPRASGVWKVNSDNSSLTQVFDYLKVSSDVFGRDGSEYDYNTSFTDGFDISRDGSWIIFGTRFFKIEEGVPDRGDAIVAYGTEFYDVGDFATGVQPFALDPDGAFCLMYRREYNPTLEYDEINVYFVPIGTGDPVKVIGGLDIFGTSAFSQTAFDGSRAITMAGNGRMPITFVDRVSASRLDLTSIDGISISIGGFRMSESWLPSINGNGDRFCFLAPSIPPQIWIAGLASDGVSLQPKISGIQFTPDYVAMDGSTTATIEALVSDTDHPIQTVTFESFQGGKPYFRALRSYAPQNGFLVDDGTFGDMYADDGLYTNNTVTIDLPETPVGEYTVRIAAVNSTLREISMVDAESLSIVDNTSVRHPEQPGFSLLPNYPNPFSDYTTITYQIPIHTDVQLDVYNILGGKVTTLVNGFHPAGRHTCVFDPGDLPVGIYYYTLRTDYQIQTRKMELLR
jgi:hypothetical protein